MDVLASSPLEALVVNSVSFGFLASVKSFWTWVAVLTAAVSFWRIRTIGSHSRPYTPQEVQPPFNDRKTDASRRPLESSSSPSESPEEPASACPTVTPVLAGEDDGTTKGKFLVYYANDRDGDSTETENWGDEDVDAVDGEFTDKEVCVYWNGMLKAKMGDLGWYGHQDITILSGNVVRLWDGSIKRGSSSSVYPPCPQPELVMGLPPHSDYGLLTILIQNGIDGFQVQRNGKWINVNPLPGSFLVNVGDQIEILSNGKYRSSLHRAVVNGKETRMSLGILLGPSKDAEVKPDPKLVDHENHPPTYRGIKFTEYLTLQQSSQLDSKSCLDRIRI